MGNASKEESVPAWKGKDMSDVNEFETQKRIRARNAFIRLIAIGLVGLLIARLEILPGYVLDLILIIAMVVILARFNYYAKSHKY